MAREKSLAVESTLILGDFLMQWDGIAHDQFGQLGSFSMFS
jgi:hypothetical protein